MHEGLSTTPPPPTNHIISLTSVPIAHVAVIIIVKGLMESTILIHISFPIVILSLSLSHAIRFSVGLCLGVYSIP